MINITKSIKDISPIVLIFMLVVYFWCNCNRVIQHLSPTYDEPLHLMQGYTYIKTNSTNIIRYDDHPILAKLVAGVGLLFLHPQPVIYTSHSFWKNKQRYSFANLMLYYNNHDAEKLLNTGRKCIIFVSCVFIVLYFILVKKMSGIKPAIIASALYCFNTTITAHSCLVTQDMMGCIFYFLGVYTFIKFIEGKKNKYLFCCAVCTSFMMVTKYTVAVLLFSYFLILLYFLYSKKCCLKDITKFFIYQFCGILLVGLIVYNKNILDLFKGLIRVISITQEGRSTFFFGKHSTKGFLLYFPVLFLVKTEIPLLILLFISLIKFFSEVKNKDISCNDLLIMLSIFIYITTASLSKMQIGHRHLLPVYPLIIWQVSKLNNVKKLQFICYAMVLWNVFISVNTYPKYISYFNEFIGGAKNGWKYFTDSNIDWGQGLKELGKWVKKHSFAQKGIYLSYFGVADPKYYGIVYKPIGFVSNLTYEERTGENIIKNNIERVIFAISVTNLQSTYYQDKTIFNFLKNIKPVYVCNDSIFIYDLTSQKEALKDFLQLLSKLKYYEDIEYISAKFL